MNLNQTISLSEAIENPKQAYILPNQESLKHAPVLIEGVASLGRSPKCTIQVIDPHVSLEHCQVEKRPHGYYVRDLKSKNGVKLNGLPVLEARLFDGARIQIGSSEFIFQFKQEKRIPNQIPLKSKNRSWSAHLSSIYGLAQSHLPVFLQGESGCGKEVLAQTIHHLSPQTAAPFISVNCGALTETLVESELFGHIKGSFTGATHDRKGAFECARGGTLFLDEIGDLPPTLQPKLLRALENNEIRPVGSDKLIKTNVRIITATHKNLEQMVNNKSFRSDLYFRINVIKIPLPTLRERIEDFEDLLNIFCKDYRVGFSLSAIEELKKHSWPGNIRELKNMVARASVLFPKCYIQPEHIPNLIEKDEMRNLENEKHSHHNNGTPFIKEFEKEVIKSRLMANKGNQRKTALELGLPKSTLHDRIKSYGIDVKSFTHLKGFEENTLNAAIIENAINSKL